MGVQEIQGIGVGNLLLISGIHGNEYTPVVALYDVFSDSKLINQLKKIYNKITFIHAANEYGIKNNIREYDGNRDLNRIFQLDLLKDTITYHISEADYIIDIHSSPNCTEFVLINDGEEAKSMVEYCWRLNIPYAVWDGSPNTIKSYSLREGKVAFTVECNGIGTVDVDSAKKTHKLISKMVLNPYNKKYYSDVQDLIVTKLETVCANVEGILLWNDKNTYTIISIKDGSILYYGTVPDNSFIITRNKDAYVTKDSYIYQYQKRIT